MVSNQRYHIERFLSKALFVCAIVLAFAACRIQPDPTSSNNCQLTVFLGKNSCPPCEIEVMRALQHQCIKNAVDVQFVTYYDGRVNSPELQLDQYDVIGFGRFDFDKAPFEKFSRDSIKKGQLFLCRQSQVLYFNDFAEPLRLSQVLADCSVCSNP